VRTRLALIGGLALLALATGPVLGTGVANVVAAFIVVVGIASAVLSRRWTSGEQGLGEGPPSNNGCVWISTSLGLLGGLVAAGNAVFALMHLSGDVHYGERAVFGWAALLLGLAASAGALLIRARPWVATALLVGGSLLGFVAINLYYINTYYFLAVPLCLLAPALAWGGRPGGPAD